MGCLALILPMLSQCPRQTLLDSLGMNPTYQPTLPFTLSFTKPFAWPRSSYGDFLKEGGKGIPPASNASWWCLLEWMYTWDHNKNIKPFIWPLAEPHCLPFQLCFHPPKTTSLSSKRAWTGLGFTKGRLGLVPQFVGFGFVFSQAICWSICGVLYSHAFV